MASCFLPQLRLWLPHRKLATLHYKNTFAIYCQNNNICDNYARIIKGSLQIWQIIPISVTTSEHLAY